MKTPMMPTIRTLAAACCGFFLISSQSLAQVDDEILACWDFNDADTPDIATDVVNGHEGEVEGAEYTAAGEGRTGLAGDFAMDFGTDSGGQSVLVADADFLNAAADDDQMTVAFWQVLDNIANSSAYWMNSPNSSSGQRGNQAHTPWGNGTIFFDTAGCCDGSTQRINGPPPGDIQLDDGEWHHFAFVKDGEEKSVWVDGELAFDGINIDPLPDDFLDMRIGSGGTGGSSLHGKLDDFVIFKGALTEEEIGFLAGGGSVHAAPEDTDEDGIPDEYETANGLDPDDPGDADKDKDEDGLTNLEEYENGTLANNVDTDGDGWNDKAESNTGVWVSLENTGTNPKRADTDRDNLNDAVETNTGTFVDATNTGTDPLNKDTDEDGASDGLEVEGGTNPLDKNSVPSCFLANGNFKITHAWPDGDPQMNDIGGVNEFFEDIGDVEAVEVKYKWIHFHDNANAPIFQDNSIPYPLWSDEFGDGSGPGDRNDFAILAEGHVFGTKAGLKTFVCNSDDGFELSIDGEIVGEAGNRGRGNTVMEVDLTEGLHEFRFIHWERGGGAGVSVYVYRGEGVAPGLNEDDFELLGAFEDDTDTDEDGITDLLEASCGLDPEDPSDAVLDKDGDGIANNKEFELGTGCNDDDTDDDGLKDGVESDTGTWVSAENTGTSPKKSDTDKDGLPDGVETNTGVFVSAANTGTDPLKKDSDNSGVSDSQEVAAGSDPNDPNSEPEGGLLAFWDFEDAGDPSIAVDIVSGIEAENADGEYADDDERGSVADIGSGGPYHILDAEFISLAAATDQLTVLFWQRAESITNSSSFWFHAPSSSNGERGAQAHVPWGGGQIFFDTAGCCDATQRLTFTPEIDTADAEWHHYAFVKDGDTKSVYIDGELAFDAVNPAALPDDFTEAWIGSGQNGGNVVPAMLDDFGIYAAALSEEQINDVKENGASGNSIPFQILSVVRDSPTTAMVTWQSRQGASYTVEFATDLQEWIEVTDGVESGGETTTFEDDTLLESDEERYYRVREE